MKNYVKKDQKLPLYGVGPYIVLGMALTTLAGILLSGGALRSGLVSGGWAAAFRAAGALCIALGAAVWFIGAVRSDMDASIAENRLKTDGIYAWVRNPMYSGWWILFAGTGLLWRNAWLLLPPLLNWALLTVSLKRTEERWLLALYGDAYRDYMRRVDRCVPWPPRRG